MKSTVYSYLSAFTLLATMTGLENSAMADTDRMAALTHDEIRVSEFGACPADVTQARQRLENFIFSGGPDYKPIWADEARVGKSGVIPGLGQITGRRQIKLLDDPQDTATCEYFNDVHQEHLTRKSPDPDSGQPFYTWDVVYYKTNDYYLVIRTHAPLPQPDDPRTSRQTTARELIVVYDKNLNEIHAYLW